VAANGTVGGPYTVSATAAGATAPALFSLTNNSALVALGLGVGGLPEVMDDGVATG
jgi:hypothetical protein